MIAGLISAAIITPVNMFFPFMFKRVNTFRSTTVTRIEAIKKLQVQKKRREALLKGGCTLTRLQLDALVQRNVCSTFDPEPEPVILNLCRC